MKRGRLKYRRIFLIQARRTHEGKYQKAYLKFHKDDFSYCNEDLATRFYNEEEAEGKLRLIGKLKGIDLMVIEGPHETYYEA